MINSKRVLAVIPARKGSKGLPGKNYKVLFGKPLFEWTVEAAKASKYIDKILISTDSDIIIEKGKLLQVDVPFIRPYELCTDEAKSIDVLEHAINHYNAISDHYDLIVLLEPTSPLRKGCDIDLALELMLSANAQSVVSISKVTVGHPAFLFKQNSKKFIAPFLSDGWTPKRRQDCDNFFYLDGSVYASQITPLMVKRTFCHEDTVGFELPKWKAFEIDDEVDFFIVESIMKRGFNGEF